MKGAEGRGAFKGSSREKKKKEAKHQALGSQIASPEKLLFTLC